MTVKAINVKQILQTSTNRCYLISGVPDLHDLGQANKECGAIKHVF